MISFRGLGRGVLKSQEVITGLAVGAEIIDAALDCRRKINGKKEKDNTKNQIAVAVAFVGAAAIAYKFFRKSDHEAPGDEMEGNCAIKRPNPVKPLPPTQMEERMRVLVEA